MFGSKKREAAATRRRREADVAYWLNPPIPFLREPSGLVEWRENSAAWSSGSSGLSLPLGGGVRGRVGVSRGHRVPTGDALRVVDEGTVIMDDGGVWFSGLRLIRDWQWGDLVDFRYQLLDKQTMSVLLMSSVRGRVSGLAYPVAQAPVFARAIDLGLNRYQGTLKQLIRESREQLAADV